MYQQFGIKIIRRQLMVFGLLLVASCLFVPKSSVPVSAIMAIFFILPFVALYLFVIRPTPLSPSVFIKRLYFGVVARWGMLFVGLSICCKYFSWFSLLHCLTVLAVWHLLYWVLGAKNLLGDIK